MTGAYNVVQAFKATNIFSGSEREFKLGETVLSDTRQADGMVTIEIDKSFFVVERSIFEVSCKWRNEGAAFF